MSNEATTTNVATADLMDQYVMPNYGRFPLALERGEGTAVWDEEGKRYLDFGSGIAVATLGHASPVVSQALAKQSAKLVHCSNLYQIRPQAELAEFLVEEVVGAPGKVFFCNSGAEANEAMIKFARKAGRDRANIGEDPCFEIITFEGSFHGRTLGGIAATGQDKVKTGFAPGLEGFVHVPYNDSEALAAAVSDRTVAIMLEMIQGEGGIHVASPTFIEMIRRLCADRNLLLLVDDVQAGLGRAGNWCSWEGLHEGGTAPLSPDAVTWAKGMGGGFPIGGLFVRDCPLADGSDASLATVLGPGTHGSTFGGTPLASAVSLAVLQTVRNEGLMDRALGLEEKIRKAVAAWNTPVIQEVRGRGLMLGFVLNQGALSQVFDSFQEAKETPALFLVKRLMGEGLLTVPAGAQVVRWLPPLNVSEAEVDCALEILHRGIQG